MPDKSVKAANYSEQRLATVRQKIKDLGRGGISLISAGAKVDKTTLGRFVGGKQDISASKFLRVEYILKTYEDD